MLIEIIYVRRDEFILTDQLSCHEQGTRANGFPVNSNTQLHIYSLYIAVLG